MAIERNAHATWEGDLRGGSGRFDTGSGAISGHEVTHASRFEDSGGKTSPEELIAAAHATCFSMALAGGLAKAGHPKLSVRGEVEGLEEDAFRAAAETAKEGCPVSNALADSIEITLEATLA